MTSLVICPICTEFGTYPEFLKRGRQGHKYRCKKCNAEYWLKVVKEPDFANMDDDDPNCLIKPNKK